MEKKFKFETFGREQMGTLEKTHALLLKERESIEMDEFKDFYDDVEADKEYVEKLQAKMREEDTPEQKEAARIAEILELLYTDSAEKGRWMGDKAMIRITSIYDDIKNGIDMVTEFSDEGKFSHLGLAIDVTFSGDIRRKLIRIRKGILSGQLAKVKYYLSEEGGEPGLNNIPHVVAGANLQTIEELSNLWFQKKQLFEKIEEGDQSEKVMTVMREKLKESIDDLKGHDFQHRVLRQIEFQLEKFIEFAKKEERIEVAKKLQINLDKVREIMNLKGTPELEDVFLDLLEKEIELVFEKGEYGL